MKKLLLLVIVIITFSFYANAQVWEWTKPEPNRIIDPTIEPTGYVTESDDAHDVEIDASGNAYVLGTFKGELYLDKTFITNSVEGSYIAKYSPSGTMLWYKLLVPDINGTTIAGTDLVVNSTGIFITGTYDPGYYTSYDCQSNTGIGVSRTYKMGDRIITSSPGEIGYFLAKFDMDGNEVWTKNATRESCRDNTFWGGGPQITYNPLITTDKDNNIITSFIFPTNFSSFTLGGDVIPLSGSTSINPYHIMAIKFNSDGVKQWSTYAIAPAYSTTPNCSSIIADNKGNVFLYGLTSENCQFGTITYDATFREGESGIIPYSIFLAKVSPTGEWQFAKELCNFGEDLLEGVIGNPDFLAVDDQNNVYALVSSGITPLSIMGATVAVTTEEPHNFIVKLDNTGQMLWNKGFANKWTNLYSIHINNNALYITGGIQDGVIYPFNFDNLIVPKADPNEGGYGNAEYFVLKSDPDGNFQWATSFAASFGAVGFAVKAYGDNIYTTGNYKGSINTLGPLGGVFANEENVHQIFFGKLKDQYIKVGAVTPTTLCAGMTITIPFISYGLTFSNTNTFTAQLSDANSNFSYPIDIGSVVSTGSGTITATLPNLINGSSGYRIRIKSSDLLSTGNPYYAYADRNYAITVGLQTFYQDADGDGFGNANTTQLACTAQEGYVSDNTDCDDTNPAINPHTEWYQDADNDGYYTGSFVVSCVSPGTGYKLRINVIGSDDCDDNNELIHTPVTYYRDADGDGYGNAAITVSSCSLAPTLGYVVSNADCNDNDATIRPGATDICDGIDNDCDGLVDEDCSTTLPVINIADLKVYESQGNAVVTVSLSKTYSRNVRLAYTTVDGTAIAKGKGKNASGDYIATKGNLSIPAGSNSLTISIPIINDNLIEGDEIFKVQLSNANPSSITIADGEAIVTIKDGVSPAVTQSNKYNSIQVKPDILTDKLLVKVMPNPSTHRFTLVTQSPISQPLEIRVMDILGRVIEVRSMAAANGTLNIGENYYPGVYLVQVMQGSQMQTLKLAKISN